jgi:myosin heavy subunit
LVSSNHKLFSAGVLSFTLLLIAVLAPVQAIQPPRDKLIAVYLYRLAEHIQWPNENEIQRYHIHLIEDNESIHRYLQGIAKSKKLHGKFIEVSHSTEIKLPPDVHIVYLPKGKAEHYLQLFRQLDNQPVLLISDGVQNRRDIMINLIQSAERQVRFEINKANILAQGLGVHPDIVLLGGTEIDIAKLYREGQVALSELEQRLRELQQDVSAIESEKAELAQSTVTYKEEVKVQQRRLAREQKAVASYAKQLEKTRIEMDRLKRASADQQQLLEKQATELKQTTQELTLQREKVSQQQAVNSELQVRIEKEQHRFEALQTDIKLQEENLQQKVRELKQREIELRALQAPGSLPYYSMPDSLSKMLCRVTLR